MLKKMLSDTEGSRFATRSGYARKSMGDPFRMIFYPDPQPKRATRRKVGNVVHPWWRYSTIPFCEGIVAGGLRKI